MRCEDQRLASLTQVQWTQGATQPGSSGAALIDADTRKVVGVLTGGTTSCSIFSGSDYFGKLSVVSRRSHAYNAMQSSTCLIGSMHCLVSSFNRNFSRPSSQALAVSYGI